MESQSQNFFVLVRDPQRPGGFSLFHFPPPADLLPFLFLRFLLDNIQTQHLLLGVVFSYKTPVQHLNKFNSAIKALFTSNSSFSTQYTKHMVDIQKGKQCWKCLNFSEIIIKLLTSAEEVFTRNAARLRPGVMINRAGCRGSCSSIKGTSSSPQQLALRFFDQCILPLGATDAGQHAARWF